MQKIIVIGALLVSFLCVPASTFAASSLDTLTPNALYGKFMTLSQNSYTTTKANIYVTFDYYNSVDDWIDDNYLVTAHGKIDGYYANRKEDTNLYDWDHTVSLLAGTPNKLVSDTIRTIGIGDDLYINFPESEEKKIRDAWARLSKKEFDELGKLLDMEDIFDASYVNDPDFTLTEFEKDLALVRKHNLYSYTSEPIIDEYKVTGAQRYDLELNPDAIHDYYLDLYKSMTAEERLDTPFTKEFLELLEDSDYVEEMSSLSYVSLWFDKKTEEPRRLLNVVGIPGVNAGDPITVISVDVLWTDMNKVTTIKVPSKTLDFESMADALEVSVPTQEEKYETAIKDTKKELKKAKTRGDKAILNFNIAEFYAELGNVKQATAYYKKSASQFPKKSVYEYVLLAEASAIQGDVAGARKNFEAALRIDPTDELVLDWYGWFLMGLSEYSPAGQDLDRVLEINTNLASENVNDMKLAYLYATYILQGKKADADALQPRFDNFKSGDVSVTIAQAYHRMGDTKNKEKFLKQAMDDDFELFLSEERFFAKTFKK